MKRYNFPAAPLILGVILGPLAERYFLTSLANYDNNLAIFVQRPISGTILGMSVAFIIWATLPGLIKKYRQRKAGAVA
jgi:putative tricarboxylic transport membrane protein